MSENAIAIKQDSQVTDQVLAEYLKAFGLANELTAQERAQFVQVAKAYQLNPFKREIYCLAYGQGEKRRLSLITGYEVYLKRAERDGRLRGWNVTTEGTYEIVTVEKELPGRNGPWKKKVRIPTGDMRAIVTIHRADWALPFQHEVYLDEYAQDNEMWAAKPRTMLKKVAVAQAFRMAFPDEMGGMPYTSDELPEGEILKPAEHQEPYHAEQPAAHVEQPKPLSAENPIGKPSQEALAARAKAAAKAAGISSAQYLEICTKHGLKRGESGGKQTFDISSVDFNKVIDDINAANAKQAEQQETVDIEALWAELVALTANPALPKAAKAEISEANAEDEKDPEKLKAIIEKCRAAIGAKGE